MTGDDEQLNAYKAAVLERLQSLGVDPSFVAIEYQDELQDYEIAVSAGALTRGRIEAIVEALHGAGALVFTEPAASRICNDVLRESARRSMQARAATMPGLPVFDSGNETLAEFLRKIESYCGFEPGSVLEVFGDRQVSLRATEGLSREQLLLRSNVLLTAAVALHGRDDLIVGVTGGT